MRCFSDRGYLAGLGALGAIVLAAVALAVAGPSGASGTSGDASVTASTPTVASSPAQTAASGDAADGLALDYARALDLGRLRDALSAYYARYARYPDTSGGVETLCGTLRSAGCDLREVAASVKSDVAFGDGEAPYWYQSDGATYFVLVARASLAQGDAVCPASLPEPLREGPVMCLRGGMP
mgnify:CR=1 FL=1